MLPLHIGLRQVLFAWKNLEVQTIYPWNSQSLGILEYGPFEVKDLAKIEDFEIQNCLIWL